VKVCLASENAVEKTPDGVPEAWIEYEHKNKCQDNDPEYAQNDVQEFENKP
jgi:hypothetical protein